MPTRADGLEAADRIIEEGDEVMARCDRENDHEDHEAGCIYDSICRVESEEKGHAWTHGLDFGKPDDKIDPPSIWPSKFGQEGRRHRCAQCGEAKAYSEFQCSRTLCNTCFEKRSPVKVRARRLRHVSGFSRVGAQAAGA